MRSICVIGTGYVGLVTGACFAELGNRVSCVDIDEDKIAMLNRGETPFFEPGLSELVSRNAREDRLSFSCAVAEAVRESDVVFIAVGTPTGADGHADLSYVRDAAIEIAKALNGPKVVVNKSTVPVETGDLVASLIREHRTNGYDASVVSNPEFLREGSAISDFMKPDRIVLGVSDEAAAIIMQDLYEPLGAPIIVTDIRTAEMIKYTANAFLATKISFINEVAKMCERIGANIKDVVRGAGSDARIGPEFLNPGLGFGGSCFPKDVLALAKIAEKYGIGPDMLNAVLEVNRNQIVWTVDRVERSLGSLAGKRVGVLGLSFKPNTDDVRESPAIALVRELLSRGAIVVAHDPAAVATAKKQLGDEVTYVSDVYDVAKEADCLALATDWNAYKQLDLARLKQLMRGSLLCDARNIYDSVKAQELGFVYLGVGLKNPVDV